MTKKVIKKLRSKLAEKSDRDFERTLLPFLHIMWPELISVTPLMSWDSKGIDFLTWQENEAKFKVVVQAKGFKVLDTEVGKSQIEQCLKSIKSFSNSGHKTKIYALIHNRSGLPQDGWNEVKVALDQLVNDGVADEVYLFNRYTLIENAEKNLSDKLIKLIQNRSINYIKTITSVDNSDNFIEKHVSISRQNLYASSRRLIRSNDLGESIEDPASLIARAKNHKPIILIGEAGYGKTTTLKRVGLEFGIPVLFADAALAKVKEQNVLGLMRSTGLIDDLLSDFPETEREIIEMLARSVISTELLRQDRDDGLMLLIDGLDESLAFIGERGITSLFNSIKKINIPVVISMRSELWITRQTEFATATERLDTDGPAQSFQHIDLIELNNWNDSAIANLALKYAEKRTDEEKIRLLNFAKSITEDSFEKTYGDIPRRPLFLKFLLESISEGSQQNSSPLTLISDWINRKLIRDYSNPIQKGGDGRIALLPSLGNIEQKIKVAYKFMEIAATIMTYNTERRVELKPFCFMEEIEEELSNTLTGFDRLAISLNTLLIPVMGNIPEDRIKFSHRVFQEFFLARSIFKKRVSFNSSSLPDEVQTWLIMMEESN